MNKEKRSNEVRSSELIEILQKQADEIAIAGHAGWGNTMIEAADMLQKYMSANEVRSDEVRSNEVELADSIYAYLEKAHKFPEHLISKELAVEIIGKLMLEARRHDIIKVLFALNNKYLNN